MQLTQGRSAVISATLKQSGVPVPFADTAAVTATLYSPDGRVPLGPPKTLSPDTHGANWAAGLVVVNFTEQETAVIYPPAVVVRFTAPVDGVSTSWSITVSVDLPQDAAGSLLFPVKALAISKLRRDRLMLATSGALPSVSLSDEFLWDKLRAAEAEIGHQLRVPLAPTRFFSTQPTQQQIDALGSMAWAIDPPYDYNPADWYGDKWGLIQTRQKPLQSIVGMKFVYPSPAQTIVDVPADWIRIDGKYGQLQVVPTGTMYQTLLGGIFLSHLTGGKTLPFTVALDYVAGLANVTRDYPDLVDAAVKLAVTKIVEDGFMPQSGSISADGLSQSLSVDVSKYHDAIDRIVNGANGNGGLMARIHGVRTIVM